MGKSSKRVSYIDVARGITMLCIIAGHMDIWIITRVVFTFHVPFFFILSGYFFHEGRLQSKSQSFLNLMCLQVYVYYLSRCVRSWQSQFCFQHMMARGSSRR